MKTKNYAFQVEDIGNGLKNITGLSYAVYEVLFRGTFTKETYEGAVWILVHELERISELTEKIIEEMYEDMRKDKEKTT